ncbi:MAG: hypothetical protein DYH14_14435 [Betaproteobacteria bacterium PRO3]|nr:hypothetical protein [Betaproteobacteria bacterium PRO3]
MELRDVAADSDRAGNQATDPFSWPAVDRIAPIAPRPTTPDDVDRSGSVRAVAQEGLDVI